MLRIALLLLLAASGCLADSAADLRDVLAQGVFPMWPHLEHEGCTATCDGEPMPKEPNVECWGDHLYICKGNSSVLASKCEGHFLGLHVPDKGMWVGVCEGLSHKFAHYTHTCPKTGASKVHFVGKGCLGASSTIIKGTKDESRPEPSSLEPASTLAPLLSRSGIASGRLLDDLAAELGRIGDDEDDNDEDERQGSYEGRCDGRGGEVFGVKYGAHTREAFPRPGATTKAEALFDSMKATVEAHLGPVTPPCPNDAGRSDRAAAVSASSPPAAGLLSSMIGLAADPSVPGGYETDRKCSLTCNEKEVGWHGLWPCWGKLEVACKAEATAVGGRSGSFSGECKGLWTGALGKLCFGLTQTHSTKTWSTGSAEADGICTGHLGVRAKKSDEGAAMGQWCHGRSVGHVAVEKHATTVEQLLVPA